MSKIDDYRKALRRLGDWDTYHRKHSGLPGPRGNLELAQAAEEEGSRGLFERYLGYAPGLAPEYAPDIFLAFCGVVGMERLIAEGHPELLPVVREFSRDPCWRIQEGVAIAL